MEGGAGCVSLPFDDQSNVMKDHFMGTATFA